MRGSFEKPESNQSRVWGVAGELCGQRLPILKCVGGRETLWLRECLEWGKGVSSGQAAEHANKEVLKAPQRGRK